MTLDGATRVDVRRSPAAAPARDARGSSVYEKAGGSARGQPIGEEADPLLDREVQHLEMLRQVPANSVLEARRAKVDGVGHQPRPAALLERPNGARHVKGASDQHPDLPAGRRCQRDTQAGVLGRIARAVFENEPRRRDALVLEEARRHRGLANTASDIPYRATAAGEQDARCRKALRQSQGRRVALGAFVELHLAPMGTGCCVFAAAEHDDAVEPAQRRLDREPTFERLEEKITERQNGEGEHDREGDGAQYPGQSRTLKYDCDEDQSEDDD